MFIVLTSPEKAPAPSGAEYHAPNGALLKKEPLVPINIWPLRGKDAMQSRARHLAILNCCLARHCFSISSARLLISPLPRTLLE